MYFVLLHLQGKHIRGEEEGQSRVHTGFKTDSRSCDLSFKLFAKWRVLLNEVCVCLSQGKFIRIHFGTTGKLASADIDICELCWCVNKLQIL